MIGMDKNDKPQTRETHEKTHTYKRKMQTQRLSTVYFSSCFLCYLKGRVGVGWGGVDLSDDAAGHPENIWVTNICGLFLQYFLFANTSGWPKNIFCRLYQTTCEIPCSSIPSCDTAIITSSSKIIHVLVVAGSKMILTTDRFFFQCQLMLLWSK